ncbi:unnamed protein product [Eretmochelys imbricata]
MHEPVAAAAAAGAERRARARALPRCAEHRGDRARPGPAPPRTSCRAGALGQAGTYFTGRPAPPPPLNKSQQRCLAPACACAGQSGARRSPAPPFSHPPPNKEPEPARGSGSPSLRKPVHGGTSPRSW